jgi:hypothetical protein
VEIILIDWVCILCAGYVKLIDVGRHIIVNKIEAYLPSRVIHFLMNLHITPRPIWYYDIRSPIIILHWKKKAYVFLLSMHRLTRHGESEYNVSDRIGGDSPLTTKGDKYAQMLADWVDQNIRMCGEFMWKNIYGNVIAKKTKKRFYCDRNIHSRASLVDAETLYVWTSTLKRSIMTAQYINRPKVTFIGISLEFQGLCPYPFFCPSRFT